MTLIHLRGDASLVVNFPLHSVQTFWEQALERGEQFIHLTDTWVRTADIYAITGVGRRCPYHFRCVCKDDCPHCGLDRLPPNPTGDQDA